MLVQLPSHSLPQLFKNHFQHHNTTPTSTLPVTPINNNKTQIVSCTTRPLAMHKTSSLEQIEIEKREISVESGKKLESMLIMMKEERTNLLELRQKKREFFVFFWKQLGNLMYLQKPKIEEDYLSEKIQNLKQKIYRQLLNRNNYNSKMLKKFRKKFQYHSVKHKSSNLQQQQSQLQLPLIDDGYGKVDTQSDPIVQKWRKQPENQKVTSIHTIANQTLTLRNRTRPHCRLAPVEQECRSIDIKAEVQSSFKNTKRRAEMGRTFINNIVFQPERDIIEKRKGVIKDVDKSLFKRFEKHFKSNKVLMRGGAVRMSLQEYTNRMTLIQSIEYQL